MNLDTNIIKTMADLIIKLRQQGISLITQLNNSIKRSTDDRQGSLGKIRSSTQDMANISTIKKYLDIYKNLKKT